MEKKGDFLYCLPVITCIYKIALSHLTEYFDPFFFSQALAAKADATTAPFGMKWDTEESITASDAAKKVEDAHSHSHGHGHS